MNMTYLIVRAIEQDWDSIDIDIGAASKLMVRSSVAGLDWLLFLFLFLCSSKCVTNLKINLNSIQFLPVMNDLKIEIERTAKITE